MTKTMIKYGVAALLVFMLTGCGIYKKYELPAETPVVSDYAKALQEQQDSTSLGNLSWREVFTDPTLQRYIQTALDNNKDLDNARLNVNIANSQLKGAKLSYLPSLAFAPNGAGSKYGKQDMGWSYQLPLQASWEIDFGKILNQKRAAQVGVEMAEDYRQATQSQIICAVARTYYQIVLLNQQLDLTKRTAVIWEDQVRSMKLMKQAGMTNEAAVVQAQANLHSLLASIPDLELNIHQAQNALSLLLNTYPQKWAVTNNLDFKTQAPTEGNIPISYLAVRPDVRAAERNFAAAYYATNQARANFYPSLTISANGGFTNALGAMISNPGKWFVNLAGSLVAPIFSRGRNIAQLEVAKAREHTQRLIVPPRRKIAVGEVEVGHGPGAGDGQRFAAENTGGDLPVQAVVLTEVARGGRGAKAAEDRIHVQIGDLKLLLELLDLLFDEFFGNLFFQIVDFAG